MAARLFRLQPLRPPIAVLEPGLYLARTDTDSIEIELSRPIDPAALADLIRDLPNARRIAA